MYVRGYADGTFPEKFEGVKLEPETSEALFRLPTLERTRIQPHVHKLEVVVYVVPFWSLSVLGHVLVSWVLIPWREGDPRC